MIPKTKHTTNPKTILSTNLSDNPTTITMIIKHWSRPNFFSRLMQFAEKANEINEKYSKFPVL
jgi:hypothetical protein